ncbi:MAG: ABC transporter ATP-binding protein [Candidatus Doudnabacteria bacterium]|nr:ABC transporter ATP-binding protein [Candidatus Doudnabacteria bacterium]
MDKKPPLKNPETQPSLFGLLKPYRGLVAVLILLALLSNGLTLWVPLIISHGIDGFIKTGGLPTKILWEFSVAAALIFVFIYLQNIAQTYASERVAKDLRNQLSEKISGHSYSFVEKITGSKLLTNLTADADSVKTFVSQAVVNITSSLFIIIGASILLLSLNWQLALVVLAIIPIIGGTFFFVLGKVRKLFIQTRAVIDRLNKTINESILGAGLIRVLNSRKPEDEKFNSANSEARNLGLQILKLFASMIPVITFASNLAVLAILTLGGHYVITGSLSLGNFAAFYSYLIILIFPILIIGFMSNIIAQAQAAYGRIWEVLSAGLAPETGKLTNPLKGAVAVKNLQLNYGQKPILKDVSISFAPGSKTAIIGPTAAGKTQLLYLLIGLIEPSSGSVEYDGHNIHEFQRESLHQQVGFVFQDSIIFNMSLRENIGFNTTASKANMDKAVATAELEDFIHTLPQGLDTVVSERGASLSGGQKQRVMLARALALNPKILLLDDFTARVDNQTERKILENISKNYPELTLISVTQKIAAVEHYDQIVLLMEGELVAAGTHETLLHSSPEYAQIYESQKSTSHYE